MAHKAFIAKVEQVVQIEGAKTVQMAIVLGTQLVVGLDTKVGDIGVFFPSELQLSNDYCRENNLFRDSSLNKNNEKSGFFDDNRRVRAQKFLKIKSDGYFAPIESLKYTGYDLSKLTLGTEFDELGGIKICEKYMSQAAMRALRNNRKNALKKVKVIEAPTFKEHVDTEQFAYYSRSIQKGSVLSVSAKYHGTSFRCANLNTIKLRNKWKKPLELLFKFAESKLVKKLDKNNWLNYNLVTYLRNKQEDHKSLVGKLFFKEGYDYIAGSRRVTLFEDRDSNKVGFHGPESYRFEVLEKLKPFLKKDMIIFGEIFGYVNGAPIMGKHDVEKIKDKAYLKKYGKEITYKYGCKPDEYRIIIYRISQVSQDGELIDYTVPQLKAYCDLYNLPYAKMLVEPFVYDGDEQKLIELVNNLTEGEDVLGEDFVDPSHIREGVVIRVDYNSLVPKFFKSKNFAFKLLEGIAKEKEVDLEDIS